MCPALRPRQDRLDRPYDVVGAAPAMSTTKAPTTELIFRGSITRPLHSLSTLRRVHCCTRRKTRFPLLATLRDGIGYPQDSNERFQSCLLHLILPSQAFLAQCQFGTAQQNRASFE